MSIGTSDMEQYSTSLLDYAKDGKKSLEDWCKGANLGQHEPNDEQFRIWFETLAHLNPNWLLALQCRKKDDPKRPAVEGADELLVRYQRVLQKGMVMP